MKKPYLLCSLLLVLSLTSCGNSSSSQDTSAPIYVEDINSGEEVKHLTDSSSGVGEYLSDIEAYSNNTMYSEEHLLDDSGMNGSQSYLHLHSSLNPRDTMWLSKDTSSTELVFKFSSFKTLGRVYIWNYNNFAKIDCGIKSFTVSYSSDGVDFVDYEDGKAFSLTKGDGSNDVSASKVDESDYLDLKGITARYLKIVPIENYLFTAYGLSEIRFFSYQGNMKKGARVASRIINFSSTVKYRPSEEKLVSGSALYNPDSIDSAVTNNPFYMHSSIKKTYTFSLGGQYPLGQVGIWNYNGKDHLDYGVKKVMISTSLDGETFFDLGSYEIPKASGQVNQTAGVKIDGKDSSAQYVRISYEENYGGEEYGLSAIQFYLGEGVYSCKDYAHTGLFSSYSGWTGSDGIFGTRLNGDQSIGGSGTSCFNFSDTYFGSVDSVTKHRTNNKFTNNSFGNYSDGKMEFITDDESLPLVAVKDTSRSTADAFYWLGDSFVVGSKYYVSSLYIAKEGALGFTQKGEDLYSFDIKEGKVDFSSKNLIKDNLNNKLFYSDPDGKFTIIFGAAIFENTVQSKAINPDEYIYNYGYRDDNGSYNTRSLVVCRVKAESVEDLSSYEYYDGEGWTNDIKSTSPLTQNGNVSCEMSVTQINNEDSKYYGQYVLCYQKNTTGKQVCLRTSSSLYGLFSSERVIFNAEETMSIANTSQYNAKIHPVFSTDDELVLSYNLNESKSGANATNGDIYHPRFVKVSYLK